MHLPLAPTQPPLPAGFLCAKPCRATEDGGGALLTAPTGTQSHQPHLIRYSALQWRSMVGRYLFPFSLCMDSYVLRAHACQVKSVHFSLCFLFVGEGSNLAEMELLAVPWKAGVSLKNAHQRVFWLSCIQRTHALAWRYYIRWVELF